MSPLVIGPNDRMPLVAILPPLSNIIAFATPEQGTIEAHHYVLFWGWEVERSRGAPMTGSGDGYRLRAADMLAKAEHNELLREDFENLAKAYLRLAEQADRNAQMSLPFEPEDEPAPHQRQRSEQTLQQQQQLQPQPKDEAQNNE